MNENQKDTYIKKLENTIERLQQKVENIHTELTLMCDSFIKYKVPIHKIITSETLKYDKAIDICKKYNYVEQDFNQWLKEKLQ